MTSRIVLVVGATSGIGLATALRFAEAGDRVVLMARSAQSLERAADMCRVAGAIDVVTVVGDTGSREDTDTAVAAAAGLGGLDVVVHTATVMAYGSIEEVSSEVFSRAVHTAVDGTLYLCKAVIPVFRGQGHGTLVVVNSLLGSVTVPLMGAYATAKWAQRALVRTLQQEVRSLKDVHICLVSPGSVNTPIYRQAANVTGRAARPPQPVISPERVAGQIHRLAERPRRNVSVPVGIANPVIVAGFRVLPSLYDTLVGPLFKLLGLTRETLSRTDGNVHQPQPEADVLHGHWPADERDR